MILISLFRDGKRINPKVQKRMISKKRAEIHEGIIFIGLKY